MKYIFLHGLGQVPSDWETTIKRLDLGVDVDCPNLSDWLSGKEASYLNLYHALESYCEQQEGPLHLCGLSLGGNPYFTLCIGTCRESSLSGINWYAIYHAEAVIEISEYDISPYAKQEFSQNGIWKKRFYQSIQIHDGFRFSKRFRKNKLQGTCVMWRKG